MAAAGALTGSDVVGILASTQHSALVALSHCMKGSAIQGLTAAAREAKRRNILSAPMARKCERLGIAAHYARHTIEAKGEEFMRGLITALSSYTVQEPIAAAIKQPNAVAVSGGEPSVAVRENLLTRKLH